MEKQKNNSELQLNKPLTAETTEVNKAAQEKEKLNQQEIIDGYNPAKGIPAALISQLFISLSRACVKYLYDSQEQMGSIQLMYFRAIVAFIFNVLWNNIDLKNQMYTNVSKDLACQLFVKVVHGNMQACLLYTAIMYWPLSTTAAARLVSPLFVIILSCIFLREFATRQQLFFLLVTLSGAVMIVVYTPEDSDDQTRLTMTLGSASFVAYLLLVGEPIFMSVGQVLMRKLRKLSNQTVSCYTNLTGIVFFLIWALCSGQDLSLYRQFSIYDWLALIAASILLVFAQIFYFRSFQYLPAPALLPLQFGQMVYQFCIDYFLFVHQTNWQQLVGVTIISIASVVQVVKYFCYEAKIDKEKKQQSEEVVAVQEDDDKFTKQTTS